MESAVGDWSELLPDLLVEIAIRVGSIEDFMAFKGVCTSWRAAATNDKFAAVRNLWHRVPPLLMLAEKKDSDEREFYSLSKRKICMRLPLPEAKGKRCTEAGFGWLLTAAPSGEVSLLNPFSRARLELPNYRTFPEYERWDLDPPYVFIQRALLSENPSESKPFVLMVVVARYLGFWRLGDKNWTRIESHREAFANVTYHNQKFYAVNYCGHIWVWDPNSSGTRANILFRVKHPLVLGCHQLRPRPYLVESSDARELLLVFRDGYYWDRRKQYGYGATTFELIRLNLTKRSWKVIPAPDNNDAIFVGENAAVSINAAVFPDAIRGNCIYFTDDSPQAYIPGDGTVCDENGNIAPLIYDGSILTLRGGNGSIGGGRDMGIYSFEDRIIRRFNLSSFSFISPPLWIALSFS